MNQIARQPRPAMTADEFLDWPGDGTGRKFELVDGELRPVAPASPTHGLPQANLAILLGIAIRTARSKLKVATESGVIHGERSSANVRVPDVIVTGAAVRRPDRTVTDPVLSVEVLSPGNQSGTRENVGACKTIGSVVEILVLHSTRVRAEVHRRDPGGSWPAAAEIVGPGGKRPDPARGWRADGSPAAGSCPSPSSGGRPSPRPSGGACRRPTGRRTRRSARPAGASRRS